MAWYHRLLNLGRSDRLSRDIQREIDFHIAERTDELRAGGMTTGEARLAARRRFGNPTVQRERTRDADVAGWLDSLLGDVRYAIRALLRSPAFSVVAIASLSLGIGANVAIFGLIDALVLRPLPVPNPERLAQVVLSAPAEGSMFRGGQEEAYFTNPLWEELRDRQQVFSAITAFGGTSFDLSAGGEARRVAGAFVSGDFFTTFGAHPAVGRLFVRDDDRRGCAGVAVLSHATWQREYGGARDVVGRSISLTGNPFQIVGVAAEGFRGPEVGRAPDVYTPLCAEAIMRGRNSALDRRSQWFLRVIGRMKPGVTVEQAGAHLASIAPAAYGATVPEQWGVAQKEEYATRSFFATSAERGLSGIGRMYGKALVALMAGVCIVLLIACANVANLLLSRAAVRQRELAIRLAIGAARSRLVRQLLTESAILALVASAGGLVVARLVTIAMVHLISGDGAFDRVTLDVPLDGRLLAFTILVAVVTVLLFGLAPAWRATRVSAQTAMKAQGRGIAEGHSRFALGKALVVAQVALSLTLVVGAGLLVGTFRNLSTADAGFDADGILLVSADLGRAAPVGARFAPMHRSLLERLRALPGVVSVSGSDITPVSGSAWNEELVVGTGEAGPLGSNPLAWFNEVTSGFFATMGTRIIAGRDFTTSDVPGSTPVAIVNDALARKLFGDENPLGRTYRTRTGDRLSDPVTIVGVVENAKYRSMREESEPVAYVAATQNDGPIPAALSNYQLRTTGNPRALVPAVTAAVRELHPRIVLDFDTMSNQLAESLRQERMLALLSAAFGTLALGLAVLGLYGVMAYSVARRRNEIGVRIALGADRRRVIGMVLREVAIMVTIGIAIGGAASLGAGRAVGSFLYRISPTDPRVIAGTALLFAAVALAAGLVPAWRAARVDPMEALRQD